MWGCVEWWGGGGCHEAQTVGVGDRESSKKLSLEFVGVSDPLFRERRSSVLHIGEIELMRGSKPFLGVLSAAGSSAWISPWVGLKSIFSTSWTLPVKKQYLRRLVKTMI